MSKEMTTKTTLITTEGFQKTIDLPMSEARAGVVRAQFEIKDSVGYKEFYRHGEDAVDLDNNGNLLSITLREVK